MDRMAVYRVYLTSKPSPGLSYYSQARTVYGRNEEEAVIRAKAQMRTGVFKDRGADAWHVREVRLITQANFY